MCFGKIDHAPYGLRESHNAAAMGTSLARNTGRLQSDPTCCPATTTPVCTTSE